MVGKLIYLTITRPDVCFAVNQVSQHMQAPKIHHWNMVERILRYLREAPGLWMASNKSTELLDIVMQIGLVIGLTGDQPLVIVHSLEETWLHGRARSRRWSLAQVLRLSTEQ